MLDLMLCGSDKLYKFSKFYAIEIRNYFQMNKNKRTGCFKDESSG